MSDAKLLLAICAIVALCGRSACQLSGDFSEEDYDDLSSPDQSNQSLGRPHAGQDAAASNRKRFNLTADKIQDYLFSIQAKVLASNDVLTVKDRKAAIPKKDKFYVSVHRPSKSPSDQPQSDQPSNGHTAAQSNTTSTHSHKPVTTPSAPIEHKPWNGHQWNAHVQQATPNSWNCEFKSNHDCGILNDLSVGDFFHLESRNFFRNFNWNSWYLLLNSSSLPDTAIGARLITPYMETKNVSQGCLSMQYITISSAVARVTLYQQDKGNQCVWSTESSSHSPPGTPVNHQLDFTVDLFRGSPRFFLELYLDHSRAHARETVFALANLRLAYRPCFNDNANQCRPKPQVHSADNSANSEVAIP